MDMNQVVRQTSLILRTSVAEVERFLDAYATAYLSVERQTREAEAARQTRETTVTAVSPAKPETEDVTADTVTETPRKSSAKVRRTAAKPSEDDQSKGTE